MVQISYLSITTRKNHSFDCMDVCQYSDVSVFWYAKFVIAEHIYQLKSTMLDEVTECHSVTISLILMNMQTNTWKLCQNAHSDSIGFRRSLNCCIFFLIFFISWRLITLQYCTGFSHTLKWISHGFTCIPHPDPPSHLPLHPLPLGLPSEPGPSACLVHPAWAGDLFHPR